MSQLKYYNPITQAWEPAVIGAQGPQGDPGPSGLDGALGPVGPAGPTGAQGPTGPVGPPSDIAGPTGAEGSVGPTGATGPTGSTGPYPFNYVGDWSPITNYFSESNAVVTDANALWKSNSNSTNQKPSDRTVDAFLNLHWIPFNKGADGSNGSDGATGATGPTGPQGVPGVKGDAGLDSTVAGPTGPTGPTGADGLDSTVPGPTGAVGPTGADGVYNSSESEPIDPQVGDIWFNEATGSTYLYYDNAWVGVGGGTAYGNWQVINSNTTAIANTGYIANTSAGTFTVIMPENPVVGESIAIIDGEESFKRNGVIVSGGVELIEGRTDNLLLNVDRASVLFRFIGSTYGWKVV